MKNLIIISFIIFLSSCEREYEFKTTIIVEDYYTGQPIPKHKVLQSDCISGLMWGRACENADMLLTDENGKVNYSATKESKFGNFLEFEASISDEYMTSGSARTKNGESKTFKLKPFTKSTLKLNHNFNTFDSIRVFVGNNEGTADLKLIEKNNSSDLIVNSIPDEINYLLVYAYETDSLIANISTQFIPSLDSLNYFEFELKE